MIPIKRYTHMSREQLERLVDNLDHPFIVEDAVSLFQWNSIPSRLNKNILRSIQSGDHVGFVPVDLGGPVQMTFTEAMLHLYLSGGYINGWEYFAGDCEELHSVADPVAALLQRNSLLTKLGYSGHMLDSVMRWIFVSKGPNAGSPWHVDPIGSAAWMLQITGEKTWYFRTSDTKMQGRLSPGDLLLIPSEMEHRVINIGEDINVAISHNWVKCNSLGEAAMWNKLLEALDRFEEFAKVNNYDVDEISVHNVLEKFQNACIVDNLLFGLLMSVVFADTRQIRYAFGSNIAPRVRDSVILKASKYHKLLS